MGLKQDVASAMRDVPDKGTSQPTTPTEPVVKAEPVKPPVDVSGDAVLALSKLVRSWTGWPDARLMFGVPEGSPHAECDHVTRTITANADTLVRNPNRVLRTVTPFRLRQEAVLTGILLHEAGHARHSHWLPCTEAEAEAKPLVHSDGTVPTKQVVALARLMEEPRIEGLMARDADKINATGLGWTMKASAAHLIPTTVLDVSNPNQTIMDLITSWTLRAGRQIGLNYWLTSEPVRQWVTDFSELLHQSIVAHLSALPQAPISEDTFDEVDFNWDAVSPAGPPSPHVEASQIISDLREMIYELDDDGPSMIDGAREVLRRLFPETPPEQMPMAGSGCGEEQGTPSEESSPGAGSGEGTEEGAGADESGEQGEDGGQGQSEGDEPGDGGSASSSREPTPAEEALAKALAEMEAKAAEAVGKESGAEAKKEPPKTKINSAGSGGTGSTGGGWRDPTKPEREIAKGAENFMRELISPTETNKVSLSDSPSATVDPAALAAWRADGGTRTPYFFKRTRREVEPSPPVKIAILVDVSSSMTVLQAPSAILSWALASAALDLRNFAGRGQQIESTLIHWGRTARVIQRNGEMLPGIREVACNEGTTAMGAALALVAEEIPGFFSASEKPVNRLLVQFTDWELWGSDHEIVTQLGDGLASGMNMLSVVPSGYAAGRSKLDTVLRKIPVQRGTTSLIRYTPLFPDQVWESAMEALS